MCGIVGILAYQANAPFLQSVPSMRDAMPHRGPDDAGAFIDAHIALGQRRLSIIDLTGGAQPMSNAEQSLWVLNNGEIYNYQDLRKTLTAQGYTFRTQSDTEAIIHGYGAYGDTLPQHLRGMFALAVWDVAQRTLFIARDRAGQKPLYYADLPEGFFFASEIKALLAYDNMPRDLDFEALSHYFRYQSIPEPFTIFKHIRKLPPAHQLTINLERDIDISQYWQWGLWKNQQTTHNYQEAVEHLREQLETAVQYRLISDVPLGALLSGGVDSSAVVAMMAKHSEQVKTFSIGFKQAAYDERPYARQVANFCSTDHQELVVEAENIRDVLPKLAWQYDEPLADMSTLPTYYVCKMAREHVTVALAGDGGDESFAGYARYAKFLRLAEYPIPQGLAMPAEWLPLGMVGRRTARLLSEPLHIRYDRMNAIFEPPHLKTLLANYIGATPLMPPKMLNWQQQGTPLIKQLQQADFEQYMPSTVLVKVDRASMLNSLEVRAPLLDHVLLDYIATLPSEWLMGKKILKDAIRGLVPDSILERRKAGFGIPLEHWFQGDYGDFVKSILLDSQTRQRGLLNTHYIEKLIDRQHHSFMDLTMPLWTILMFELWCRAYDIS